MELLAVLDGILVAIMLSMNGGLSQRYGNYHATVLIHLTGLLLICLILWRKQGKFNLHKKIPWFFYLAGPIGVLTVIINNLTILTLGVTATIALGLLGQTLTSLVFDHWGILGMPKRAFHKGKWIGVGLIIFGIVIMMI